MQASNALSLSTLFSIFLYEIMGVEDGLSLKSSIWKERRFFGVFDIDFFDDKYWHFKKTYYLCSRKILRLISVNTKLSRVLMASIPKWMPFYLKSLTEGRY